MDDDGRVRGGGAAFDMRGSLAPAASSSGSAICGMAKLSLSAGFATISSITSFNGGFALPLPMRRLETDPRDESTLDPSRLLIEPVAAGGPTTAGGVARKDGTMSAFWAVASEAPPAAGCVTSSAMAAVSESGSGGRQENTQSSSQKFSTDLSRRSAKTNDAATGAQCGPLLSPTDIAPHPRSLAGCAPLLLLISSSSSKWRPPRRRSARSG